MPENVNGKETFSTRFYLYFYLFFALLTYLWFSQVRIELSLILLVSNDFIGKVYLI